MTDALAKKIAQPDSLAEERLINAFFSEEPTTGEVNEGNLLSLNTIKKVYDGDDEAKQAIIEVQKTESKYLVLAMKLLTGKVPVGYGEGKVFEDQGTADKVAYRLRSKYGSDLRGAMGLAKLLKTKADEAEFNSLIKGPVDHLVEERSKTGIGGFV